MYTNHATKFFIQPGRTTFLPALVVVGGGGATTSFGGSIVELAGDGVTALSSSAVCWTKLSSCSSGIRSSGSSGQSSHSGSSLGWNLRIWTTCALKRRNFFFFRRAGRSSTKYVVGHTFLTT
ncbi:hypothetical protein DAPPUDRAFT_300892 [Daphnia pulex]|uniref:Uncharacterized protein n=1 Tax=Daphnia pulex TaxID=6669 RepID=E9I044_DAPPU|nr:hypothetical protein DAPPUDRAFT_300892 [Daphnia pulex]|eukprot:EFX62636.1 hypothetical protein DAPPUDRAFT_300892 [Daphnia pulex]